jgi:hypothetical protein
MTCVQSVRMCHTVGKTAPRSIRSSETDYLPSAWIASVTEQVKERCLLRHLSLLRMDFAQMSPVVPLPYPCSTRFTSNGSFSVTTAGPVYLSLHGDVPPNPQAWREVSVNLESSVSAPLGAEYKDILHSSDSARERVVQ